MKIVGKIGLLSSRFIKISNKRFPCPEKILASYMKASGARNSVSSTFIKISANFWE